MFATTDLGTSLSSKARRIGRHPPNRMGSSHWSPTQNQFRTSLSTGTKGHFTHDASLRVAVGLAASTVGFYCARLTQRTCAAPCCLKHYCALYSASVACPFSFNRTRCRALDGFPHLIRSLRFLCSPLPSFREAVQDEDKPLWERKGQGITPLEPDTETVQNINEHRWVRGLVCFNGRLL